MTTSTTSKLHVGTEDDRDGGGAGGPEPSRSQSQSKDGGARLFRRASKGRAALAGALLVVMGGAPAFATPSVEGAVASPAARAKAEGNVDLRLDVRAASRLLAEGREADATGGDDKAKSDSKGEEKAGDKGDDGVKMTVSKGAPPAAKSSGSDDTFAFVKDWPFWAIVGGVVIVGASVYMINRNSSQDRSCPSVYNAGCFGAK